MKKTMVRVVACVALCMVVTPVAELPKKARR